MRLGPLIQQRQRLCIALGFLLLLGATVYGFLPGLGGTLIFDDIPNFQPWQDLGDLNSAARLLTFSFSGAGLPGRPLSLLSFALDDQSWPPDIHALKRTNLALHLLNTCLVLWLALQVFRRMLPERAESHRVLLALMVSGLWSLHPLQVSNVSYIIQRMNLLSTTLELTGMLLFLQGRGHLQHAPRRALLLCTLAVGICMPLAVLAKENGLLLCAFALLLEHFCFAPFGSRPWRVWKAVFLWGPLLGFVLFCLYQYRGFTIGFEIRPFNAWERLLTQGPVLLDYLQKLLLPRLHGSGLYFDNFPVSRSLLSPGTLPAWLALAALLAVAAWLRHRLPLVSLGIFFYFTGHLMESTVLPLELYYEHRNYLPQLGLWLALAGLAARAGPRLQGVLTLALPALLLMLLAMTRHNAALWGNPALQTAVWYHDNPGSLRSTLAYANLLLQRHDFTTLDTVLQQGMRQHPHNLALVISHRYVRCYWLNQPVRFDDLPALAEKAEYEVASILMLEQMHRLGQETTGADLDRSGCRPATDRQILAIYQALLRNPRFATRRMRAGVMEFSAEIATQERQLDAAMYFYDEAFTASANPIYPYRQALLLASAGLPDEARRHAARAQQALGWRQRLMYPDLEARIHALLRELAPRPGAHP